MEIHFIKKITADNFSIEQNGSTFNERGIENYSLGFKNKIIFINGKLVFYPMVSGLNITDFSDFKSEEVDSISQLNSSLAKKGFTIKVEKDTVVENPIEILFFINSKNDNFVQYRNKIVVGDNAQVKFIERIQNLSDAKCFVNHFTQITIGKNSSVEYNKIQDNTKNSILLDTVNISQKSDSV